MIEETVYRGHHRNSITFADPIAATTQRGGNMNATYNDAEREERERRRLREKALEETVKYLGNMDQRVKPEDFEEYLTTVYNFLQIS